MSNHRDRQEQIVHAYQSFEATYQEINGAGSSALHTDRLTQEGLESLRAAQALSHFARMQAAQADVQAGHGAHHGNGTATQQIRTSQTVSAAQFRMSRNWIAGNVGGMSVSGLSGGISSAAFAGGYVRASALAASSRQDTPDTASGTETPHHENSGGGQPPLDFPGSPNQGNLSDGLWA